ncbi:glycerophosphodiester phosphodiesterase [Nocardioides mangrovi]|uniref:GP-PDE domain-containing protein n=1 Tax=Nocardioides mangrovi TaxID=2874580 RepID=A0ABS7UDX1_9ACTN|nr:glycerophosphodiester phosphodiesterase family protein [Nocardioides mangrovi]MBZ5738906.1 hypothetical protein [Nocardioides mangrovi]
MATHPRRALVRHLVLAVLPLVVAAPLIVAPPASALDGSVLIGHRCRTYDAAVTNEDTVAALADVAAVPGATCEVDVWRLADNHHIIWHDDTWERVADPATLPEGVLPTDRVADATWDQVSQIRTLGGEPVATLRGIVNASARYGVPLMVELRNGVADPQGIADYVAESGASVSFYKQPSSTCDLGDLPALHDAGLPIGLKLSDTIACQPTNDEVAATGASYVTQAPASITPDYTADLAARGIAVYARWVTESTYQAAFDNGAAKVMVDRPADALAWELAPPAQ